MAGTFRSFTYGSGVLYGDFGPSITQSHILAQCLDYTTVQLTLDMPDKAGQRYSLVRSGHGAAEDPSDGVTIDSGVVGAIRFEVTDTLESRGESSPDASDDGTVGTVYYTLFGHDDGGRWYKDAATSVVVPTDKTSVARALDFLPTTYTSVDGNPFSPTDTDSDLAKFLAAFDLTYNELSSMIDVILPENRNRHNTRQLASIFSTGVGMPNEYLIGVAANARLAREAGFVYRNKGTLTGIATYVEALTGWQTVAIASNNKFLSLNDGSFETGTGNWSWDPLRMSLESAPIDNQSVYGPDVDFETSDYSFSRQAVGLVTLQQSAAEMVLPGGSSRLLAIPVRPEQSHFLAVPVRATSGTPVMTTAVEWWDSTGTEISTSYLSDTTASSSWSVAGGTIISPANAAFAVLHIGFSGNTGDSLHLDMLSFSEIDAAARTNLFPNPSAEDGLSDVELVDATGRSLVIDTDYYVFGTQSWRLSSADTTAVTVGLTSTNALDITDGETVTGSAYVRSTLPTDVDLTFTWFDETGTQISQSSSTTPVDGAVGAGTSRLSYTVTAPPGTTSAKFSIQTVEGFTSTDTLHIDGVLVEISDRLGDWFFGKTGTLYGSDQYSRFVYSDFLYPVNDYGYIYRDPQSVTIVCQPDRLNLVFDPQFEGSPSAWTIDGGWMSGALLTSTSDDSAVGTTSGLVQGTEWTILSNDIPVTGPYTYSLSIYAKSVDGTATATVRWYDYSDSLLQEDVVTMAVSAEEWTRTEASFTSPTRSARAVISIDGTNDVYLDGALFERAERAQEFFSGALSDLNNQDGRWSSTSVNSYSLLYNKLPVKMGRLKQTLPFYIPAGMTARVLLWDSPDPVVQALVPRGIYN